MTCPRCRGKPRPCFACSTFGDRDDDYPIREPEAPETRSRPTTSQAEAAAEIRLGALTPTDATWPRSIAR